MRIRACLLALLGVAVLLGCANLVFAQASVSVAQLTGTVLDESGGSVAKASISVRETDTNLSYTVTSNDTGFYVLPNLPPGRYELKVSFAGFANHTQTGIELRVGQTATINITLKVAARGEQVVVSTEVPAIEPTKTEISQVIDTKQIDSLPISNRRFTDFALLVPGVATSRTSFGTTFTEFEATQISFGGMRSFSNEITVDGAEFVNTASGVQRATPPQESVQEFRVVNNGFGADYGRAVGGIVNIVTKSGTNEFHGSIYDYLQNSALDARSLLQPSGSPFVLRQNQFGATLGGPIKASKTFFFLNYEGQRRAESPTLPTDLRENIAEINLAKANIGINVSENVNALKTNNNDYGFARLDHQINANNRLGVRYVVENARDLRTLVGNTEDGGGVGTPSAGRDLFIRDQSVFATLDTNLRPNLINSSLVQFAQRHYNFPGSTGEPDLSIPNDLEFGHNFGTYDAIFEDREQIANSVAWVKGNHVAKFGYDSSYIQDRVNYPGFTPMRIILPSLNCLFVFANFMAIQGGGLAPVPGPPCPVPNGQAPLPPFLNFEGVGALFWGIAVSRTDQSDIQVPLNNQFPLDTVNWPNAFPSQLASSYDFKLNHSYQGFYVQDQWRLTPKLTLNYGLRYDFETGLSREIVPDYLGFQPRIGLAYSPNSKTVIRAGFGIFDDRVNLTFFFTPGNQKTIADFLPGINLPMVRSGAQNGGWQLNLDPGPAIMPAPVNCTPGNTIPGTPVCADAPAAIAQSILTTGVYPTAQLGGACPPNCSIFAGAGGVDRHRSRTPYAEQASLEIDHQFGESTAVSVAYLFVGAHKLVQGNGINETCPVGTNKPNNPANAQGLVDPSGTLTNCAGAPSPLLLGKPYFLNQSGFEFNNAGFLDYNNDVDNANYHGVTVQISERFRKHLNLVANYTYSHTIDLGNFTTFINLPQNQFDPAAERASSNQDVRHRFVLNFTAEGPKDSFLHNFAFSSIVTMQSGRPFTLFTGADTNGDTNPVTDRPSLVGRNSYTGDALYSWDLRVSRYFQIRERMRLDLIFDAFNFLNRPNIDEVVSVYGSPFLCGPAPKKFNDAQTKAIQQGAVPCPSAADLTTQGLIPAGSLPAQFFFPPGPNPGLGTPRAMLNPRQLQLAAKLSF